MYPAYIGGKDVEHPTGRYVHTVTARAILEDTFASLRLKRDLDDGVVDPRSAADRVAGGCTLADEEMMEQALAAAAAAAPAWARTPLDTRVEMGRQIGKRLRAHREEIVEVLVAEGQPRSLAGPCIDEYWIADFSDETLTWCAEQMHFERDDGRRRSIVRRVPDGVVCVNPPQNASTPNALFGITAMLAGNTVVVRTPRSVPLATTYVLREIVVPVLDEFQAPPGTLNVLCAPPTMDTWLASPHVNDIVYVGSTTKGLAFEQQAIAAGKKPILELAGNDCCVVWRDADLDGAVRALTETFRQSGQICNIPNQVVAHPAIADELLDRLVRAAREVRPGYPDEPGVVLTPALMADAFFANISDAVSKGAVLVHGGRRLEVDGTASDTGFFLEPTVLRVDGLHHARSLTAVRDETFSPLLPVVVPAPGPDDQLLDDVLAFVNENKYGLRNSLWSDDLSVLERAASTVTNCGVLNLNDSHSGFLPFLPTHGGTGLTGGAFGEANYLMLRTSRLQGVDFVRPSGHTPS
ncbi:aldehyde dehydrogenase family protein [Streptomyces sp. NRRL B-1347]|uniref:aldehyde dehydrogenase family protein n=1 Tax=Streptomyces sp. NRRL B-1347 TaxID=1476877 RepID=UPI00055C6403|nr:aldehyde dehydrogenase [Streptomyces sp. NRRL B-1347]